VSFFSVSCLRAIEMEAVLNCVDSGEDPAVAWSPALLLVEGTPTGLGEGILRAVTAMNARPGRKRSQMVLFTGLSVADIKAAMREAARCGANIDGAPQVGSTAVLVRDLSWENALTVFHAAGGFGRTPEEPVWHEALIVAKGWPFRSMARALDDVVWATDGASEADSAGAVDGPEGEDGSSTSGRRICMAWGLSDEQVRAAQVAAHDFGGDVAALSGGTVVPPGPFVVGSLPPGGFVEVDGELIFIPSEGSESLASPQKVGSEPPIIGE
jgi:hypothetical protein